MRGPRTSRPEVLVRFARASAFGDPAAAAWGEELLDESERQALRRLRAPAARHDYLAAHTLARVTLAELVGVAPAALRFNRTGGGRPALVVPPGERCPGFSLSHAGGMALCAVAADRAVGADVESVDNIGPDPLGLAELLCSRGEWEALRALPAAARPDRLLSLWTRKEAIVKALGLGFRFPLSRVPLDDARAGRWWRIVTRRITPRHLAAVALHGADSRDVPVRFDEASLPAFAAEYR